MSGRHTITIELDDDEYRALEAEAERIGADVQSIVRRRVLPRSGEPARDDDDDARRKAQRAATRRQWQEARKRLESVRSNVRLYSEDEWQALIGELRQDRDDLP